MAHTLAKRPTASAPQAHQGPAVGEVDHARVLALGPLDLRRRLGGPAHRHMATIGLVRRTQTIVQLNDELLEALDAEAARRGASRSALIREAIAAFLHEARQDVLTRQIVDGYRRLPPATPDEWGDLGAQTQRATLETLQRLDAEERAAGLDPW